MYTVDIFKGTIENECGNFPTANLYTIWYPLDGPNHFYQTHPLFTHDHPLTQPQSQTTDNIPRNTLMTQRGLPDGPDYTPGHPRVWLPRVAGHLMAL